MADTANKILLIILDGWGLAPGWGGNAIAQAQPPFYEKLWREYPHARLDASGIQVGLMPMIKGNSEAGHLNIGAGRIVYEGYTLINDRLQQQPLSENPAIQTAIENAKERQRPLHLMGLFSNGGIHSHLDHLFDLIDLANERKVPDLFLHLFTDGRDTDPKSGIEFYDKLRRKLRRVKKGQVVTIIGRWWAMDRDSRYERTKKAFDALVAGVGDYATTPEQAITQAYSRGITDEFIPPTIIIGPDGKARANDQAVAKTRIQSGDSVIFFNFRPDRARQITLAIVLGELGDENLPNHPKNLYFITFIPYQAGLPIIPAFTPDIVQEPLSYVLSRAQKKQLHVAETEKYAHITYFFNGGYEQPMPGEERILVPSPRVDTYNLTPAMATPKIAKAVVENLKKGYDFIVVNFANPDMIGHTGSFEAALAAVDSVDQALALIVPKAQSAGYEIIITADHGNIEEMVNPVTGEPDTEHTQNPAPFIFLSQQKITLARRGILADIAPTILSRIGVATPATMTGKNLVV